jgi:DNA-binding transcriptional LysR family regulator
MQDIFLNDWLTFASAVEAKGFSAAAKKLGLSPSVVSKRISQLETNLGARLFQRSTRSLVLTEAGQLFYEHCQRIRLEIDAAKAVVVQNQQNPKGTLRVHAPMSFGQSHLATATTDFIKKYPDIRIELLLGSNTLNLIENSIDVAISIKELPDSNLIAKKIANRSIGIYASPAYLAKHGKPQHPSELLKHNCLLYHQHGQKIQWQFSDKEKKHFSIEVQGNFCANSSQALAKSAIAGLGVAKVPNFIVMQEVREGKLIRLLEKYCHHDIGIYAVYTHKNFMATKTKLFIEFLDKRFAQTKYWQG